ncbi:glycine zipper 2TM domain-containing protein [Ramlibacter albus]|uniref:Glycine zipper 2TM domain-containing protein n=1 Tax=Ramlibacter albus TaxID=2079448 RepID=A0A923MBN4_9BURK|nr:glycine zipper 2TM domain-containing protein [Ramlibacter albus]MBC5766364.1 glycine zipper 2TM domain-containing protein [Ramlibacter albus]
MRSMRLTASALAVTMLASVVGCATNTPMYGSNYPATTVTTAPVYSTTAALEYGRVSNIEYMPVGTSAPISGNNNIIGAVIGGLAGAALGSTIGGGSGRTAATVLGGVAGAAVGSHIARNQAGVTTAPGYRVTVQTDSGAMRIYEVGSTGDLRVGDRVRVENNVIYRG